MPTKPLETVIYRDLQIARAKKFLASATPLFQELVNYGSNALIRCVSSTSRGENEDLAAMNLYRHILETTDAFEVLIAACCASPTVPIVRSSFEAVWPSTTYSRTPICTSGARSHGSRHMRASVFQCTR